MRASLVAQMVKNLPAMQEMWVWFLDQEAPLEKGMEGTPVFLPGKFHGQRRLVAWKELDMTERITHTDWNDSKPWLHGVITWGIFQTPQEARQINLVIISRSESQPTVVCKALQVIPRFNQQETIEKMLFSKAHIFAIENHYLVSKPWLIRKFVTTQSRKDFVNQCYQSVKQSFIINIIN